MPDIFIQIFLFEYSLKFQIQFIKKERARDQETKKAVPKEGLGTSLSHKRFVPMSFVLRLLASPEHFRVERWAIFDFIFLYSQLIYA